MATEQTWDSFKNATIINPKSPNIARKRSLQFQPCIQQFNIIPVAMPTCYQTAAAAAAMIKMANASWLLCDNEESHSHINIPRKKRRSASGLSQLTEMSKSSSVSSNIRTLMVTWRPGGMAGGLCPGSNVLMPRVSGAPRRCPAPKEIGSGSGSAMVHRYTDCPACKQVKRGK